MNQDSEAEEFVVAPPRAEEFRVAVALQHAVEVTQEVVKVVCAIFGLNVEISVPTNFSGCSVDAIGL
jgi:hypothetical protein